ncbi:MAG: helix-turn-helix domain-containing protein [Promethearchaeota archaeon]
MSKTSQAGTHSPVDEHVLNVASELTEKNQLVRLDRLFNICRQELGEVTSQHILDSIDRLIREKQIRPRSRLLRKGLLHNALRQEIYSIVIRNPGISFSKIRKLTSRGTKIVLWHLEVLKDFDCVFDFRFQRRLTYFPIQYQSGRWDERALGVFVLFQDARARALLTALLSRDSTPTQTLQEILQWPRQTIQYQLSKLQKSGLVDKFSEGGMSHYYLTSSEKNLVREIYDHLSGNEFLARG